MTWQEGAHIFETEVTLYCTFSKVTRGCGDGQDDAGNHPLPPGRVK